MIRIHDGFDLLLGGGLLSRNITHIYGVPGSGKTNIALMATVNASKDGNVIYIDSEGGFSFDRIKQIFGDNAESVLSNVRLIEPSEFEEQKIAIRKLNDLARYNTNLIVLDSIGALYRLEDKRDSRELGRQLAQLLRIARRYDVSVLVTNQVYTDINTGRIVPVGGDITRYWSKVMIELNRSEDSRIAIVRKHKFLPEGTKLEFKITDYGIEVVRINLSPVRV